MKQRPVFIIGGGILTIFLILQGLQFAIPGYPPSNPTVENTVSWDNQQTEQLWENACADCHSNQTSWPVYSYVAPSSFLVITHVQDGREELNISTGGETETGEMVEVIREGHDPRNSYVILHPEARLSDAERDQLVNGLQATFGGTGDLETAEDGEVESELAPEMDEEEVGEFEENEE